MEKVTPKTIRRARAALTAKAETEAKERGIPIEQALLAIMARGKDHDNVVKAFMSIDVQSKESAPDPESAGDMDLS